ncbi:MAG TPA: spermidine/putrescine ABC transporter substrate-binding protein [Firmicutes bacterium]|nr:spermidine/putrescine ABC transporter substrate-binding protein [Bacillota bacterium]
MMAACSKSGVRTLYVYNWGEYVNPQVIKQFEQEYDVKVVYDTFDSNETMYQRVKAGGTHYDVVFPSDYMVEKMSTENLLIPLDHELLTNKEEIGADYLNLEFDPNNQYSMPYFWGTVGILYDKTIVKEDVNSWSILWDKTYTDQIYMYDSQRDSLMVALKLLGYSANTKEISQLEDAKEKLIEQRPLVYAYVTDTVIESMISSNAALAVVYSGDATYIMSENENMEYVLPKEGTNIWVDNMVIPKTSKQVELAHEFINFMMRSDIALLNTEYVMYSTPNVKTLEMLDGEEWTENDAYRPDQSVLKSIGVETFRDPKEFVSEYDRIWTEVLAQ